MGKGNLWLMACLAVAGCGFAATNGPRESLKKVFEEDFYVGAALNGAQVSGKDPKATAIVEQQFNSISPENLLKWESVHPQPDKYNFKPADDYVALGQQNNMFVVGHTLIWHNQTPDWVFEAAPGKAVSKAVLLQRMEEHISTAAGRYKGRINGWDVVNEALNDDGTLRESRWHNIMGEEFIETAFRLARQTDPEAALYYNDYNLWKPAKRDGAIRLVSGLQAKGLKVDGIGMQGHWGLESLKYSADRRKHCCFL